MLYTPKGEINRKFLSMLYKEQILEEMFSCETPQELSSVWEKYAVSISAEEARDSLTVILSYLEEETQHIILSEEELDEVAGGMRPEQVLDRDQITDLLKKGQKTVGMIYGLFQKLTDA